MAVYTFDTLEQAETLKKYGFGDEQAKGLVQVIALSQTNLATKQDLNELRADMDKRFVEIDKNLIQLETRLENKIQSMTIRLASVMVLAIGTMTSLLKWFP